MKLSTRLCEMNPKVIGTSSHARVSSLILMPVTLAGPKRVHRYQSGFRGKFTVSKPVIPVRNSLNRGLSFDSSPCQIGSTKNCVTVSNGSFRVWDVHEIDLFEMKQGA